MCGRSRIEGSKHRCVNGEQGVQCENFRIDRANQERNNPENSEDVEENEEEEDQADEENGISRGSLGKVVKCIFAVRRRRRPMSDGESLWKSGAPARQGEDQQRADVLRITAPEKGLLLMEGNGGLLGGGKPKHVCSRYMGANV